MAYVVAKVTVDEIVTGLITYGLATTDTADYTGQLLWATSIDAYAYRFGARTVGGLVRVTLPDGTMEALDSYRYKAVAVTRGQLASSIVSYAHQSSGLPSWSDSEARELVLTLAFAMLPDTPGYQESEER